MRDKAKIIAVAGLMLIFIGVGLKIADKINQARCYNLPLNDFYKDKSCLKYFEWVEE